MTRDEAIEKSLSYGLAMARACGANVPYPIELEWARLNVEWMVELGVLKLDADDSGLGT